MHGLRPIPGSGYAWSQVPSGGGHAWSQVPSGFGLVSPGIRYVQWGWYIQEGGIPGEEQVHQRARAGILEGGVCIPESKR